MLLIWPLGTNFSDIGITMNTYPYRKISLKMTSLKWRPFCLGLNVLKWHPMPSQPVKWWLSTMVESLNHEIMILLFRLPVCGTWKSKAIIYFLLSAFKSYRKLLICSGIKEIKSYIEPPPPPSQILLHWLKITETKLIFESEGCSNVFRFRFAPLNCRKLDMQLPANLHFKGSINRR